ncbi:sulfite oxidase-like oxidoreductase [Tepidibacillus marianensis]|uniref:sulfite oxidase-like oxidoreductase n=1 Tax=Tepidibacillus marianensis TaxID=3131995 RepID=UPI0030D62AFA
MTAKFPVLHYGEVPVIDLEKWKFQVFGLVEEIREWSYEEMMAFRVEKKRNDIHCVTGWSKLDNEWEGIPVSEIMKQVKINPEAKHVMIWAEQGWSTNLPIDDFLRNENLFATQHNGEPLTVEHGWPLRLVIPHLYFWKSAKWLRGIEFMKEDKPGFWERAGYHMYGNPWKEERYRND